MDYEKKMDFMIKKNNKTIYQEKRINVWATYIYKYSDFVVSLSV